MKAIFIIISACLLFTACSNKIIPSATPVTNQLTTDSKGIPMLLGRCTPAAMQQQPFSKWYDSAFNAYQPNTEQTTILKEKLSHAEIEIFLGTWCGDSKREVPRLLKTLASSGIDTSNIHIIMVHHEGIVYKQSPQHEEKGKNIFRVPTAIIYQNKKETGRIIESPVESWEKDLVKLSTMQPYTPNYNAGNQYMASIKSKKMSDAAMEKLAERYKTTFKNSAQLNAIGYLFLYQKQIPKAIQTLKLNTLLFNKDSNTWDSLAEAYATIGNKTKAIELYKKVLEIKPGDSNAIAQIKKLTEE
jgi:tetratricopeptide (TPR) repeat protein